MGRSSPGHEEAPQQTVEPDEGRALTVAAPPDKAPPEHCRHGHLLDEANTYIDPSGNRACRACHRERNREWRVRAWRARRPARDPQDPPTHCPAGHPYAGTNLYVDP